LTPFANNNEGLGWDDIALRTNAKCNLTNDFELTGPACYSRFFRNGPLVAKTQGELFERSWYLNMKGPVNVGEAGSAGEQYGAVTEVEEGEGLFVETAVMSQIGVPKEIEEEIVKTVKQAKESFWEQVRSVLSGTAPIAVLLQWMLMCF
jgi:hypothetical protein